jgi:Ca2+-transporting ATPase
VTPLESPVGLTLAEVAERRARDGWNDLGAGSHRGLLASVWAVVREPMTVLLLVCGAIYMLLGDRQEASMLLGFVLLILVLTLVQERKTERALDALRDLASPRALVVREGRRERVAGRDLVRDDLIVLCEGDRVPADAVVVEATHLAADESLLTGESEPVRKCAAPEVRAFARPGGHDHPFVYAGTLVTAGAATARVHATGVRTEIGGIGRAMRSCDTQDTRLQAETRALVVKLAWVAGGLSAIAAVGYGLARHDALSGLLAGLTLAMAILPNEFPVVVTMFLALGAWRLSRRQVLTRRIPAVESLGSVTVLCVDKTGTLTENRMAVRRIWAGGDAFDLHREQGEPLAESMHETVEYSILASRRDPFDPMERAFKDLGEGRLAGTEHLHPEWRLVREFPLTRQRLAVVQLWRAPDRTALVAAAKGAPEAIAALCGCSEAERAAVDTGVRRLASEGLRVLAVARGEIPAGSDGDDPSRFGLRFVGLVGLADPVRTGVVEAVRECRDAGIRVVMITGDYPDTARAVAASAGIDSANVLTGTEIAAMGDDELRVRTRSTCVFARMLPEQKLRLVVALQRDGQVVGMTGDGVNDAPALRAAQIGIAMGARGTDVAREAAALVLLEDRFASLVQGVQMGRRIVDNLRKALAYILAVHLPIIGLTLVPIAMGWPLVLMPVHIAFLHLVIDPACSIVFEAQPAEPDVMQRPPRDPHDPLFGRRLLFVSGMQGAAVLVVVVLLYAVALRFGRSEAQARALTFVAFLVSSLALIFTNRSWSHVIFASSLRDTTLWVVTGGALMFLALVLYVPPLAALFGFAPLGPSEIALCLAAGAAGITWFEVIKLLGWTKPSRSGGRGAMAVADR